MIPPWFRSVGESAEAYAAFLSFRDQAAPRSLYRVTVGHIVIRPPQAVEWAKAYAWHARADAWDAHLRELREKETADVARMGARDRALSRERLLSSAATLANRELAKLVAASESSDMSTLKPEALLAKIPDLVRALRLEAGETTESLGGVGVGHDTCLDVSACNMEEIEKIRAILDGARARAEAEALANSGD
jgi:hypothetical protein